MKHTRPSPRKVAVALASALVAFALLYGIGANLLLSTGGLAHLLSRHPEKLRLEYAHARTWWPGRVHVEGLDLRGRDARLEWALHIDSADADIALLALLTRRFHVEKVAAAGVTFRTRFRLEAKDVTGDRIARIPPIDGFDAVPLLNPEEGAGEKKKAKFTVQLENVDAKGVREVWIDSFRLAGDMSSAGGFQLGPNHLVEVTPSWLQVRDAALTVGPDAVLTNLSGAVDAVLEPVNTDEVKGTAVLRSLTTRSGFVARAGGLRFLRHLLAKEGIDLDGGEGTFRGLLAVEHGIVKKGSSSHVELGPATLTFGDGKVDARVTVDVSTGEDDAGGWGKVDVVLSSVAFSEPREARPVATSPSIATSARIAETDLAEPPHDFSYACDAPRIDLPDLRWLGGKLPEDSPFHLDGGSATVGVHADGSKKELTAEVALASAVSLRFEGAHARTRIDAKLRPHVSFEARTVRLSGTEIEMKGLAVAGAPERPDWWGRVKLEAAELRLLPPSFSATIATTARDARPLLSFYSRMRATSPAVTTALALIPDPLVESMTADLRGGFRIRVAKGSLDLHALYVRGAQTAVRGELSNRGETKNGGFLFVAGPASAGVSFEGGRTVPVLIDAPRWFATSAIRQAGSP